MRGLATRSVRPSCLHFTPTSTSTSSAINSIRRTILPPTRKGLTAADAFTILLPSVLTAAFVADITAKKERCQEWDRQIAAVEQEAEQIRQVQLEKWSRIQRRSVARGAAQQRRWLSTAAAVVEMDEDMDPLNLKTEINTADANALANVQPFEGTNEEQKAQARFERLIATRLALQLMAQLRANRTNLYAPKMTVSPSDLGYDMSVDYLMNELEKVVQLITEMKPESIPWGVKLSEEDARRKLELGNRMEELTTKFKEGLVFLPDYIMSFVKLISQYKLGPPLESYVRMMRAFSGWSRNSAMSALVETAIWDGRQPLDSYTLSNVVFRLGSDFDGQRLLHLLSTMTRKDGYPKPIRPWIMTQVDDVRVAVPVSRSAYLISALIRATLCNRQKSFAEAYGAIFLDRHSNEPGAGFHKWRVVVAFLYSYAEWGSWRAGQRWLQTAVTWADDLYESSSWALGRVILRMLDFCVACDRQEEYETIMNAALAAGLTAPGIDVSRPARITPRMGQIRLDWVARTKEARAANKGSRPPAENVAEFKRLLEGRFESEQALRITSPSNSNRHRKSWELKGITADVNDSVIATETSPHSSPYFQATTEDVVEDAIDREEHPTLSTASKPQRPGIDFVTSQNQQFSLDSQSGNKRFFSNMARPRPVTLPKELVQRFADGTHWVPAYNYTIALEKIAELELALKSAGVDVDVDDLIGRWQSDD